jgi:ABC-2 type transport system ATP-binding protein
LLEIENLTKRYGRTLAVDGLDLVTRPGEILALLGPNGAGKTTTIRCATGLARPTSGRISIAGHDVVADPLAAKAATGFVPDRAWFYPKVTARELLRYVAGIRRQVDAEGRIGQLLERFRLARHADALIESYSHGMRQRLAFCAALLGDPRLFVTDEPMVGLDVQGHREVKRLFRELAAGGATVILTTHTLAVAEEVADRIGVMDHGRLIALGTMTELRAATHQADTASLEDLFLHLTEVQGGEAVVDHVTPNSENP